MQTSKRSRKIFAINNSPTILYSSSILDLATSAGRLQHKVSKKHMDNSRIMLVFMILILCLLCDGGQALTNILRKIATTRRNIVVLHSDRGPQQQFSYPQSSYPQSQQPAQPQQPQQLQQPPRSEIPSRYDHCSLILSGICGTEPKESFLSNGNYVVNFALCVTGHFAPIHDWEKFKPTEAMWVSCEVWNNEAKEKLPMIRKGQPLGGLGTLIFNKWIDKGTGDEVKQFKARLYKVLSKEELQPFLVLDMTTHEFDNNVQEGSRPTNPTTFSPVVSTRSPSAIPPTVMPVKNNYNNYNNNNNGGYFSPSYDPDAAPM